ncbi:MAG: MFS transporter [Planctomycetes bacterium]|nr:MFS transporter [Planctomycetota bacterium]
MLTTEGTSGNRARLALILLLAINFFNYVDRQVLAAVESEIEKTFFQAGEYDRNDDVTRAMIEGALGSLNLAFMISYMIAAPIFGFLGDRMARWLLIGIGVLMWTAASGASGLAGSFTILFLTRCCVGVGEGAYGPVAPTIIADLYPVEKRGRKLAWFYVAIPVGSACGYILGGRTFALTNDWRWAFYIVVPPGILLGLWCFLMRDPPRGQSDDATPKKKVTIKDYLMILKTPSYALNTAGMTAMAFALGGIGFWMPRYIRDRIVNPLESAGTVLSVQEKADILADVNFHFGVIVAIAGLTATIAGGWLGDALRSRFSGSYFLVSGAAMILGVPFVLLVLALPFPLAWVFVFLACFCLFFNTGPTNTILANVTHPAVRASAFALNIFIIHALGDAVSPTILGVINGYTRNMNVGFMAVTAMFLVGGICWLLGARHLERDTTLAPGRLH